MGFVQGLKDFGNALWDGFDWTMTKASDWIGDKWNRIKGLNSAHQLEVEDMKKAGLNPILSSGGSSAASAASGGGNPITAGSSAISGIASVLSSAASLTNNKNIDKHTTKQIYNSAGNLMKTVETLSR